jgi:hypothetical protein
MTLPRKVTGRFMPANRQPGFGSLTPILDRLGWKFFGARPLDRFATFQPHPSQTTGKESTFFQRPIPQRGWQLACLLNHS